MDNLENNLPDPSESFTPPIEQPAVVPTVTPETPVSDDPSVDESIDAELAAYNNKVASGEIEPEPDDDLPSEEEFNKSIEETEEDDPLDEDLPDDAEEDELKDDELDSTSSEEAIEIEIDGAADLKSFKSQADAFLDAHKDNAALQAFAKATNQRLPVYENLEVQAEKYGGIDQLVRLASAHNQIYVMDEVSGEFVPRAEPVVDLLYEDCPNEFAKIAETALAKPSIKFPGATVLQEIFLTTFKASEDKVNKITEFLMRDDYELPAQILPVPTGIDVRLAEAFQSQSPQLRAQVQQHAEAVFEAREKLEAERREDPTGYYARQLEQELIEKESYLKDDLRVLENAQFVLDNQKATKQRAESVEKQAQARIIEQTSQNFNGYVTDMIEANAKSLADKMTFLDEDMRLPQARAVISRIQNAFGFYFDENLQAQDDPMAEFHAKTLREEGINYDFHAGRELFKKELLAENKLARLSAQGASPRAIATVKQSLNEIRNEIAFEIKSLSAQYSKRFLKSNSAKMKKDITELERKDAKGRPVVRTGGSKASSGKVRETLSDIDRDRQRHNAQIQRAIESGDLDAIQNAYR